MTKSSDAAPNAVISNELAILRDALMNFFGYSSSRVTDIVKTDDGKNIESFSILNHGMSFKYEFDFTKKGEVAGLRTGLEDQYLNLNSVRDVCDFVLQESLIATKAKELAMLEESKKSGEVEVESEAEMIAAEKARAVVQEQRRNERRMKKEAANAKKSEAANARELGDLLSEVGEYLPQVSAIEKDENGSVYLFSFDDEEYAFKFDENDDVVGLQNNSKYENVNFLDIAKIQQIIRRDLLAARQRREILQRDAQAAEEVERQRLEEDARRMREEADIAKQKEEALKKAAQIIDEQVEDESQIPVLDVVPNIIQSAISEDIEESEIVEGAENPATIAGNVAHDFAAEFTKGILDRIDVTGIETALQNKLQKKKNIEEAKEVLTPFIEERVKANEALAPDDLLEKIRQINENDQFNAGSDREKKFFSSNKVMRALYKIHKISERSKASGAEMNLDDWKAVWGLDGKAPSLDNEFKLSTGDKSVLAMLGVNDLGIAEIFGKKEQPRFHPETINDERLKNISDVAAKFIAAIDPDIFKGYDREQESGSNKYIPQQLGESLKGRRFQASEVPKTAVEEAQAWKLSFTKTNSIVVGG